MADKTYGLYPWTWNAPSSGRSGYHSAPSGARGLLDWRPIGEQVKRGQSGGYGFFSWAGAPPSDLIVLGVGDCREIVSTPTMRNELRIKLGLAQQPSGATLIDLCYDVMGPLAVPDGSTGVRPLMPTSASDLEIHLAGHSIVKSLKFNAAQLLTANPTSHANRIRDVIRANLDIADEAGKLPEALGHWLMRCGYSREQVKAGAPGKKTEFDRLCSAKAKAKHGSSLKPKEPRTSYIESFPTDCADIEAVAQDQTWVCRASDVSVVSGRARESAVFAQCFALCNSAVSSADHYCQAVLHSPSGSASAASLLARAIAGADYLDGYMLTATGSDDTIIMEKWVDGLSTEIITTVARPADAGTGKCRPNGSTIVFYYTGISNQSVTDTAITGNLKAGIKLTSFGFGGSDHGETDSWVIDDEVVTAAAGGAGVSAQMLVEGWL